MFESDDQLIVTGILVRNETCAGQIVRMAVAAPHRGPGLTRCVVEELIRRARRREMSEVRVLTDTPWTSALELYRACGFAEIASDQADTHFVLAP